MELKLNGKSQKVEFEDLEKLAEKCRAHVEAIYPTCWSSLISNTYAVNILIFMEAKQLSKWEAAVLLYNTSTDLTDKVFYMAAVIYVKEPKKISTEPDAV